MTSRYITPALTPQLSIFGFNLHRETWICEERTGMIFQLKTVNIHSFIQCNTALIMKHFKTSRHKCCTVKPTKHTNRSHSMKQALYYCFLDFEHLEMIHMNENVTCDGQSDSRWTTIFSILVVCFEPEPVLS